MNLSLNASRTIRSLNPLRILPGLFARMGRRGRRAVVVVPMLIAIGLTTVSTLSTITAGGIERERVAAAFEREAAVTRKALTERLSNHLLALESTRSLMDGGRTIDSRRFERFAGPWLGQLPGLRAMGWSTRVSARERPAFEARMAAEFGYDGFRIVDRDERNALSPAAPAGEYYAITYIEPLSTNGRAFGLNELSVAASRAAIERALRTGKASATAGFALTQLPGGSPGVVVYLPVRSGKNVGPGGEPAGVAFSTIQLADAIGGIEAVAAGLLEFCLHDTTEGNAQWLAGARDCESRFASAERQSTMAVPFADRTWRLWLAARPGFAATHGSQAPTWISLAALVCAGLLAAFLLATMDRQPNERQASELAHAASRARTVFLSRMSQECRTPLNRLLGLALLLRAGDDGKLSPQQLQRICGIEQAGWQLLDRIDGVLDLARIENGALKVRIQALELAPLVDGCVQAMRERFTAAGLRFDSRIDCRGLEPLGDATRLRQVLACLLDHAIAHGRPGGRVELTATKTGPRRIELAVRDNGIGMTESQTKRLFEPRDPIELLERQGIAAGTGVGVGVGTGLVIAQHLVLLMGGTLTVRSRAGVGSVFTVSLPAAAMPAPAAATSSASRDAASSTKGPHDAVPQEADARPRAAAPSSRRHSSAAASRQEPALSIPTAP